MVTRAFGRLESEDARDGAFPLRAARPLAPKISDLPGKYFYRRGPILDQGDTGTCVAHAWREWLNGEPLMTSSGPDPFTIYDGCITRDEWAQNDNDIFRNYGTSVRAGAKYLTELGHVKSYVWAFTVEDVARWMLDGHGGVVIGSRWLTDMNTPTSEGIIRARGSRVGGHAYYAFGFDRTRGLIAIQNHWGPGWGGWTEMVYRRKVRVHQGCALLPLDDLARLLKDGGEICTAVETEVVPIPPVT